MKKSQKISTKLKKHCREWRANETGLSPNDNLLLETQLYKDWLIHDNYGDRRKELQDLITIVYKTLSPREKQVFQLLSENATEQQSAAILKVSRSLIKQARHRIIGKFKENFNERDQTSMFMWR